MTSRPCPASRSTKKPSDIATLVPIIPTLVTPCARHAGGDHVAQMQQRQVDGGLHGIGDLVERRGAQQEEVGTGPLDAPGRVGQSCPTRSQCSSSSSAVTSAKSTVLSTSLGEDNPPRRCCTPTLRSR